MKKLFDTIGNWFSSYWTAQVERRALEMEKNGQMRFLP